MKRGNSNVLCIYQAFLQIELQNLQHHQLVEIKGWKKILVDEKEGKKKKKERIKPPPVIRIVRFSFTFIFKTRACQAVQAAQGSAAASLKSFQKKKTQRVK
jgi:hypothetical protein